MLRDTIISWKGMHKYSKNINARKKEEEEGSIHHDKSSH